MARPSPPSCHLGVSRAARPCALHPFRFEVAFEAGFVLFGDLAAGLLEGALSGGGIAFEPPDDVGLGGSYGLDDGGVGIGLVFDAGEKIVGDGLQALGAGEEPLRFGHLIGEEAWWMSRGRR